MINKFKILLICSNIVTLPLITLSCNSNLSTTQIKKQQFNELSSNIRKNLNYFNNDSNFNGLLLSREFKSNVNFLVKIINEVNEKIKDNHSVKINELKNKYKSFLSTEKNNIFYWAIRLDILLKEDSSILDTFKRITNVYKSYTNQTSFYSETMSLITGKNNIFSNQNLKNNLIDKLKDKNSEYYSDYKTYIDDGKTINYIENPSEINKLKVDLNHSHAFKAFFTEYEKTAYEFINKIKTIFENKINISVFIKDFKNSIIRDDIELFLNSNISGDKSEFLNKIDTFFNIFSIKTIQNIERNRKLILNKTININNDVNKIRAILID